MCGFTGFWSPSSRNKDALKSIVSHMAKEISFRGPDSTGFWIDEKIGFAFAHLRLAIIDLNATGHQPMVSASKRFIISFNGEVYNAPLLKKELEPLGYSFKGTSDTEVMLASIEAWGLEAALSKFIGMFAFALWDTQEQRLFLVRDRLGVKPLYYGILNGVLFFGSQPKSFLPHPSFEKTINKQALSDFFVYSYIPGTNSIYKGLQKVPPGHIVSIDAGFIPKIFCYWSLIEHYLQGQKKPLLCSPKEMTDQLEYLLNDSINLRMLSDVPLGAFLSGGIDSSLVVALMQKNSTNAVKTFSIGFAEDAFNEAIYAKEVAQYLGTEHFEYILTKKDALNIIPRLPEFYDEPFADSSQIPTYLVSQMARQQVTVSLSGDGGDEFFAGYTRYTTAHSLLRIMNLFPPSLRSVLSFAINSLSQPSYQKLIKIFSSHTHLSHKLKTLSKILLMNSPLEMYDSLLTHFSQQEAQMITGEFSVYLKKIEKVFSTPSNFIEAMQLTDIYMYLPDDILTKVDRASMAHSLEAREPLLDHRIAEFSFSVPISVKLKNSQGKWILRQILKKHIPESYFNRPKQGFAFPVDEWLRKDLKDWANDLLSPSVLKKSGLLNVSTIIKHWEEHLSGKRNWKYPLWNTLMYQSWYFHYFKK